MNCDNCGNPIENDAKFCRVCGAPVNNPGSVENKEQTNTTNVAEEVPKEELKLEDKTTEPVQETAKTQEDLVLTEETDSPKEEKKGNNMTFIIIVSLLLIIIAGLVVFFILNKKTIDKNNETTTTESTTTTTTTETTTTSSVITDQTTLINGLSVVIPTGYTVKETDKAIALLNTTKSVAMYGFELMSGSVNDLFAQQDALIQQYASHNFQNTTITQKVAKGGLNAYLITYMDGNYSIAEYYIQVSPTIVAFVAMENYNPEYFTSYDEDINAMYSKILSSVSTFSSENGLSVKEKSSANVTN